MKEFSLVLIFTSNVFCDNTEVRIVLRNGQTFTTFISDVKEYGLMTIDNKTILYHVIAILETDDQLLVDDIQSFVECATVEHQAKNIIMNLSCYKKNTPKQKKMKSFIYRSLTLNITEDRLFRYHLNLEIVIPKIKFTVFNFGGSVGMSNDNFKALSPSVFVGIGTGYNLNNFKINGSFQYYRFFISEELQSDEVDSGGKNLLGFDTNVQYIIRELNDFMLTLGMRHCFDKYSIDSNRNQYNLYLGVGFNFQNF